MLLFVCHPGHGYLEGVGGKRAGRTLEALRHLARAAPVRLNHSPTREQETREVKRHEISA